MAVTAHSSVEAFFHQIVSEALSSQRLDTSPSTEVYLVGLLGDFARGRITDEPLSLLLAEPSEGAKRVATLKEVGDTSLYVGGFFSESLERRLVAVDYYISLGRTAYLELAQRLAKSSVSAVYEELAAEFPRFVDVLTDVRGQVNFGGTDVASLYDEWLATRNVWIEKRLRSMGVIVLPPESGEPGDGDGGGGYLQ